MKQLSLANFRNKDYDGEVKDDDFIKFIECCFQYSTHFTLTHARGNGFRNSDIQQEIFSKLEKYFVEEIKTTNWFYIGVSENDPLVINLYKTCEESRQIILTYFNNIFLGYATNNFSLPEDICFFCNQMMIVGTSSHEEYCEIYPLDDGMSNIMLTFSDIYETADCFGEERIDLSAFK